MNIIIYLLERKYIRAGIILFASLMLSAPSGRCQASHTSGQFLLITPDARGKSLGEGGSVFSKGAVSAYYNPALLVTSEVYSAEYNHFKYMPDLADDLASNSFFLSTNLGDLLYFGMGYFRFGYGTQEYYDEYGNYQDNFEPYDKYFGFWTAMSFDDNNSAGMGIKYVKSFLGYYGAGSNIMKDETIALDFGFLSRNHFSETTWQNDKIYYPNLHRLFRSERDQGLAFGLSVANLGDGLSYIDEDDSEPLPRKLRVGSGYQAVDSEPLGLQLTLDATKILVGDSEIAWSYGLESEFYYLAVIRIGRYYDYDSHHRYTAFGFSLGPEWLRLDFSSIPGDYADWKRKAGEYSISLRCNISRDQFKNW